ncbi:integral membrane protein [Phlyctema vagabunda]|uniref:Integral membrane protein n=1 Tax=Phlyctema vagabunda TaxID=108571 RepID=A0ABR4PX65_9HELO
MFALCSGLGMSAVQWCDSFENAHAYITKRAMSQRSKAQIDLNISLIIISCLFYSARCYSRFAITRNPSYDDALVGVGLILVITFALMDNQITWNGIEHGFIASFYKGLPSLTLVYFSTAGIVRLGIAAFLPRLIVGLPRQRTYMTAIVILATSILALTVGSVFGLLFKCSPVKDLWHQDRPGVKCYAQHRELILVYLHSSLGVLFDICLFLLPVWVIKSNSITIKPQIILVFCVAFSAVICGILRLVVLLITDIPTNSEANLVSLTILTVLEVHVGLWVACFPALQPLLRSCCRQMGLKSTIKNSVQFTRQSRRPRDSVPPVQAGESDTWVMLENQQVQDKGNMVTSLASRSDSNATTVVSSPVKDSFGHDNRYSRVLL